MRGDDNMMNSKEVSKWFIYNNPNLAKGLIDENIKVNKLLYFSQLMFYAVHKEKMLNEDFVAFPNGPVVYGVYADYRYGGLDSYVKDPIVIPDKKMEKVLQIINFLYASKSARDLIDETHCHNLWASVKKFIPNNPKIIFENAESELVEYYSNIYDTYKDFDFSKIGREKINENVYYYDKTKIKMTEEILEQLYSMPKFSEAQFIEDIVDGEIVLS